MFLSRTGGSCLGGIMPGNAFVGRIIVATLVGLLFELLVDCLDDSTYVYPMVLSPPQTVQCVVSSIPISPVLPSSQA